MSAFLALIVAAATAAFAVNEASPLRMRAPEDHADFEEIIDPSPLLETAVVLQLDATHQRIAFARLVGGIMISGTLVGLVVIAVTKAFGVLLAHFARGS